MRLTVKNLDIVKAYDLNTGITCAVPFKVTVRVTATDGTRYLHVHRYTGPGLAFQLRDTVRGMIADGVLSTDSAMWEAVEPSDTRWDTIA